MINIKINKVAIVFSGFKVNTEGIRVKGYFNSGYEDLSSIQMHQLFWS